MLVAVKRRVVGIRSLKRLPALTPVVNDDSGSTMSGLTDDLDTTLAVLVRCSDRAFIRRHHPIVTRERIERVVTLILTN